MTDAEKKARLRLVKDVKDIKESVEYLVEAMQLIVEIETRNVEKGKR
jgi:hypothetical protein